MSAVSSGGWLNDLPVLYFWRETWRERSLGQTVIWVFSEIIWNALSSLVWCGCLCPEPHTAWLTLYPLGTTGPDLTSLTCWILYLHLPMCQPAPSRSSKPTLLARHRRGTLVMRTLQHLQQAVRENFVQVPKVGTPWSLHFTLDRKALPDQLMVDARELQPVPTIQNKWTNKQGPL